MRRLLEIFLVLMLVGCQTPPPAPPPPPPAPVCPEPPPPPEIDELKVVLTTAEELRKAMALSQGRSAAELAQAAAQLDVIAGDAQAAEPLKPLASLLSARLAEQRRLQENVDRLTQQLRDSQRRNEQLNEKLEALKAIEQTLPAKR
jgi:membrane-bound lytic murein transglycosylase B